MRWPISKTGKEQKHDPCGGKDEKCLILRAANTMRKMAIEDLLSYHVVILTCLMRIDKELHVQHREWKESISVKYRVFVGIEIIMKVKTEWAASRTNKPYLVNKDDIVIKSALQELS